MKNSSVLLVLHILILSASCALQSGCDTSSEKEFASEPPVQAPVAEPAEPEPAHEPADSGPKESPLAKIAVPSELAGRADAVAASIREATEPSTKEKLFFEFEKEWIDRIAALAAAHDSELAYYGGGNGQEEIEALNARLSDIGARVSESEGTAFIERDPSWLEKRFDSLLPERTRKYLTQVRKEADERAFEDAAVIVEWTELGDRIAFWEKFIGESADFPRISEIRETLRSYSLVFLTGLDNTPVHESLPGAKSGLSGLDPKVKAAWERFLGGHPDSPLAPLLREWLGHLKANAGAIDPAFRQRMSRQAAEITRN